MWSAILKYENPITLGSIVIRQDNQGRFCLNDLHKASGSLEKISLNFLGNKQTIYWYKKSIQNRARRNSSSVKNKQ